MSLIGLLTATEKQVHLGQLHNYETLTVASQKQLEGSRITRESHCSTQIFAPPFKVVAGGKQCA